MIVPCPAFFPVIHPVSVLEALRSVEVAVSAGADGIFLIDQGMSGDEVLALAADVVRLHPSLPVGINLLSSSPLAIMPRLTGRGVRMIWSDNAWTGERTASLFRSTREAAGWQGAHFGGVAFKYHTPLFSSDYPEAIRRVRSFVDVVTTSGTGTGVAPSASKTQEFRSLLGVGHPLAVASGITPINVTKFVDHVDAFLVASGIEKSFGVLDEGRTRDLSVKIHEAPRSGRTINLPGAGS